MAVKTAPFMMGSVVRLMIMTNRSVGIMSNSAIMHILFHSKNKLYERLPFNALW